MQACFLFSGVVHVLCLAKLIDAPFDDPLFQLLADGLGPFLDEGFIVVVQDAEFIGNPPICGAA